MMPAQFVELGYVRQFSGRSVRLRRVEIYCSLKADGLFYNIGQLGYGELFASAYINMTVAYLAQSGNGAATSLAVVTIYGAVCPGTIVYRRLFLYAYYITEVNVKENVDRCVGHIFAPKEFP